jgi:hypothetical protein
VAASWNAAESVRSRSLSGLTLIAELSALAVEVLSWAVGGGRWAVLPAEYSVDNHSRPLMESAP